MLAAPPFESAVVVTDDPVFAARISALFARPGRYLPVLDGPRMERPDAENEVVRRRNAMVMVSPRQVLMGALPASATEAMGQGWKGRTVSDLYEEHVQALRGVVKRPTTALHWGTDNLGVGLYLARHAHQELQLDLDESPNVSVVEAGSHLLVACERGVPMAEVVASNLAFACGASLAMFSELSEGDREDWLEDLYALAKAATSLDASARSLSVPACIFASSTSQSTRHCFS